MATEKLFITTANQTQAFLGQLTDELRAIRDDALLLAVKDVKVDIIEQGSTNYASLWNYMYLDEWQTVTMLHYIGHSSAQGLYVEGVGQQPPSVITKEALASLFGRTNQLRFVFLNSCCSQEVATTLLQAGVPYVIGTSAKIQDKQAVQVAKIFYQILGDVYASTTIEQAFDQTIVHFKANDKDRTLQESFRQGCVHRGGIDTSVDELDSQAFLWQLYKLDSLTDAQRNWRLIPPKVVVPTETNELFAISESPESTVPTLRFFLSYSLGDQALSKELVLQIRAAFSGFTIKSIWNDRALTDPADREKQIEDNLTKTDYIFLFVNDNYLTTAIARQVISLAMERWQQRSVTIPIILLTDTCDWQTSSVGGFRPFPDSGVLAAQDLSKFADRLYAQWLKEQRQKRQSMK